VTVHVFFLVFILVKQAIALPFLYFLRRSEARVLRVDYERSELATKFSDGSYWPLGQLVAGLGAWPLDICLRPELWRTRSKSPCHSHSCRGRSQKGAARVGRLWLEQGLPCSTWVGRVAEAEAAADTSQPHCHSQ